MEFKPGVAIGIPVEVSSGAFLGESFVTIETISGPLSGFVHNTYLITAPGGGLLLPGTITEVSENMVTARIQGSYFTSTGLASFSTDWAREKLEQVG